MKLGTWSVIVMTGEEEDFLAAVAGRGRRRVAMAAASRRIGGDEDGRDGRAEAMGQLMEWLVCATRG